MAANNNKRLSSLALDFSDQAMIIVLLGTAASITLIDSPALGHKQLQAQTEFLVVLLFIEQNFIWRDPKASLLYWKL